MPASWQISTSGKVLTVKGQLYGHIQLLSGQVAKSTHSNHELHRVFCSWKEFATPAWQGKSVTGLFGDVRPIEENNMAQLLLVNLWQPQPIWTAGIRPQVDATYSKSLFVPDTWIERRIPNPSIQDGMRRYGVGRRIGQCSGGEIGIFPEDARQNDSVVFLYGARNPYVLRNLKGRYLLVGDASKSCSFPPRSERYHLVQHVDFV